MRCVYYVAVALSALASRPTTAESTQAGLLFKIDPEVVASDGVLTEASHTRFLRTDRDEDDHLT
ncbi:hypothetical protein PI124_g18492 [Phytophthora idaei]|nr:hypothetical protein PI125_g19787 [Phytophthora idaei]KAG3130065.1 hypothetical protein PI126_g20668 [Phytophthora idaei]KAG3236503.1 hypothetical protein PI124_g18492 [Phytophthora idaei]